MSWDKNTIITSELDAIMRVLTNLEVPFEVIILGEVQGFGLNDEDYYEDKDGVMNFIDKMYPIRKLSYGDNIVLEQMHRTHDCDFDDILVSYNFKQGTEPKEWKLEIYVDEEDYQ